MLKKYKIPSAHETRDGWAIIVLDTDSGFFATVSAFGSYAYLWTHPGGEFRAFLAGLEADYLCQKLTHGRGDAKVFDEEKTKDALLKALAEHEAGSWENMGVGWSAYDEEREKLMAFDMPDAESYLAWQAETLMPQPGEYGCTKPNPDAMSFCTKVWPRFAKMLKDELAQEESDLKALKEARPALMEAAKAGLNELTKGKG